MPHSSVKLNPGVDLNETPALNETGISSSNLIRFVYDRTLGGLIQKLGGWTKFYPYTFSQKIRALWPWQTTQAVTYLAVGTQSPNSSTAATLSVIANGSLQTITPTYTLNDITVSTLTPTVGSSIITINDSVVTGITGYDPVYIATHIAVGGIVLFGLYQCDPDGYLSSTSYTVQSTNVLGLLNPAISTAAATLAQFTTTSGSATVTVTLANHGYQVGSTYPVLVSTTLNGVTMYGNYVVQSVPSSSTFTVIAGTTASASGSAYINGNKARYIYNFGVGAIPSGTGYGVGAYGSGGYGTGTAVTPSLGTQIVAYDWTLDNWGEILIACPSNAYGYSGTPYSPIYAWNGSAGAPTAVTLPNGPPVNEGVFMAMPQRQLVAYGSTFTGIQDPLLIRWCDVNNFSVWVAQVTNQAGSYRIPKGSKIVGAIQGPQQGLVWTDLGIWAMQYVGPPYVYSFNEIGSGCGMIAKKAAGSLNGGVYWMGPSQFYSLTGNGVEPVACPIWDVVFQDLDTSNLSKIRVAVNSRFGEISWFYPTIGNNGEISNYVKYNVYLKVWDYGTLSRSAWTDQSVLGAPIGSDPNSGYIYQHETSTDADGQPLVASFQTGYFALNEGDLKTFVDQVWPDMKWGYYGGVQNATINLTFYVADYPGQTPIQYGPYSLSQATTFITPRFRGRLVSIGISSNDVGSFWRLGNIRYRSQQDGKF